MNKTLHQKLTSKASFLEKTGSHELGAEGLLASIRFERNVLESLAADLLQPRSQAIAAILEMARGLTSPQPPRRGGDGL